MLFRSDRLINDKIVIDEIINHLISQNHIKEITGHQLTATTSLLDWIEKHKPINSNIPVKPTLKVVDEHNNPIGDIIPMGGKISKINLASKRWKVVNMKNNKLIVKLSTEKGDIPRFALGDDNGYYYSWLPPELKEIG